MLYVDLVVPFYFFVKIFAFKVELVLIKVQTIDYMHSFKAIAAYHGL